MPVRVVFVGGTEFAWHMLDELLKSEAEVCAVYSPARDPAGTMPDWRDLGDLSGAHGIEHGDAADLAEAQHVARLRELNPNLILAMGDVEPIAAEVRATARLGAVGSHPSLLPRNRGRDAIPWHILNGESVGGLTFFVMTDGVDDGPVVLQRRFAIELTDTARTLYDKAAAAGRRMLPELLAMAADGALRATPQDASRATHVPPRRSEDDRIDWKRNARKIYDLVRARTEPWSGAFLYLGGRKVTVWEAGFSHEPAEGRAGEVMRVSDRGVEVVTGAGLVVLRTLEADRGREQASEIFARTDVAPGAVLT